MKPNYSRPLASIILLCACRAAWPVAAYGDETGEQAPGDQNDKAGQDGQNRPRTPVPDSKPLENQIGGAPLPSQEITTGDGSAAGSLPIGSEYIKRVYTADLARRIHEAADQFTQITTGYEADRAIALLDALIFCAQETPDPNVANISLAHKHRIDGLVCGHISE